MTPDDPLKADFRKFLFLVWKHLGLPNPTKVQYEIAQFLQHGPRRRGIKAFRGVGKSYITVAYAVWRLYCNPQKKILVVSGAQNLADNFSTFCLQIINLVPELHHLRPRDDQRSSKIQFDVGPAEASKDPSVRSAGITGQITGGRADEIIADDIETPRNSQTQLQRDKLSELVKEFEAILKPEGVITYLGTPQCEQSIYNVLPSRGYCFRVWPARYPTREQMEAMGESLAPSIREALTKRPGTPTDPERFSKKLLDEIESAYGVADMRRQYDLQQQSGANDG